MAWFDLEYANLVACFDAAVRLGADEVVAELPQAMRVWFFRHRGTDDQARLLEAAAAAAGRLGRDQQRASLLADLGYARAAAGRLTDGPRRLRAGRTVRFGRRRPRRPAWRCGPVSCAGISATSKRRRRSSGGRTTLFEKTGNRGGQAQALAFDGWVTLHLGQRPGSRRTRPGVRRAGRRAGTDHRAGHARPRAGVGPTRRSRCARCRRRCGWRRRTTCRTTRRGATTISASRCGSWVRFEEALEHHRRAFELLEPLAEAQLEIDCPAHLRRDLPRGGP